MWNLVSIHFDYLWICLGKVESALKAIELKSISPKNKEFLLKIININIIL